MSQQHIHALMNGGVRSNDIRTHVQTGVIRNYYPRKGFGFIKWDQGVQ